MTPVQVTHKMAHNKVIELQKFYQTTKKPIWYAHPRAKFYLVPYFAAFGLSLSVSLYYTVRAGFGLKANQ
ncbi:unnamed protein product [Ambrosiozyma monospora]|uniref:Unnamed protein product n=1 Tax=Ambrosiozyma monospora TaxID=43982 RepID=A0ACB5SUW4_AMBMO|nr:unnamed protein product [Ambrosiozyma monospora]